MKLSILIPTIPKRKGVYTRLFNELYRQISKDGNFNHIQVLCHEGENLTIGEKRNILVNEAEGQYITFIDDDDLITDCYVRKQLEVANSGLDCGQLRGLYFENGVFDRPFIHSLETTEWYSTMEAHYRNPNHLNCIRRDIMLQCPFPDKSFGEDHAQSKLLQQSGLIKTQYEMRETLYLYFHVSNK